VIKIPFILLIKFYQKTLSLFFASSCRFSPSCSQFMIDSINKFGVIRGVINGVKRILRCHPFSKHSGWDPA